MDLVAFVDHLHTPLSVLMTIIFCALVAWVYAPKRRKEMDDNARIPLRDDR